MLFLSIVCFQGPGHFFEIPKILSGVLLTECILVNEAVWIGCLVICSKRLVYSLKGGWGLPSSLGTTFKVVGPSPQYMIPKSLGQSSDMFPCIQSHLTAIYSQPRSQNHSVKKPGHATSQPKSLPLLPFCQSNWQSPNNGLRVPPFPSTSKHASEFIRRGLRLLSVSPHYWY